MLSLSNFTKKLNQKVVEDVLISLIKPCPYQSRNVITKQGIEDLALSIKENGILQPLTATLTKDGEYQLISGHRRLIAARNAGLNKVPVIVLEKTDKEIAVLNIVENIQREDLNFFEEASAIKTLIEELDLTQAQVAQKLSLSQPAIANKLKLLCFSEEMQFKFISAKLTERHARAVSRLNEDKRDKAIDYIIKNNLNVKLTDEYINFLLSPKKIKKQNILINIKDIRIFKNTINKAVNLMQKAGINTEVQESESDEDIFYTIRVPKIKNAG